MLHEPRSFQWKTSSSSGSPTKVVLSNGSGSHISSEFESIGSHFVTCFDSSCKVRTYCSHQSTKRNELLFITVALLVQFDILLIKICWGKNTSCVENIPTSCFQRMACSYLRINAKCCMLKRIPDVHVKYICPELIIMVKLVVSTALQTCRVLTLSIN